MKSTSDRASIAPAAFGSLMDPVYLRQAADDSNASFANVNHAAGFHPFDWAHLRARVKSFGTWVLHRPAH